MSTCRHGYSNDPEGDLRRQLEKAEAERDALCERAEKAEAFEARVREYFRHQASMCQAPCCHEDCADWRKLLDSGQTSRVAELEAAGKEK